MPASTLVWGSELPQFSKARFFTGGAFLHGFFTIAAEKRHTLHLQSGV